MTPPRFVCPTWYSTTLRRRAPSDRQLFWHQVAKHGISTTFLTLCRRAHPSPWLLRLAVIEPSPPLYLTDDGRQTPRQSPFDDFQSSSMAHPGVFLAPGRRATSCEGARRLQTIEHGDERGFPVLVPLSTVYERARRLHAAEPLPAGLLRCLAA